MSRLLALVGFLALVAAGCDGQKPPARGTVRGRVTLGAKPVTGATVLFTNAETGIAMNAPLDRDGRYEVKSHLGAGLPPGRYVVAVTPGGVMTPDEEGPLAGDAKAARAKLPATPVPDKYHKAETSGLTVEVKEGDNSPFNFALTP
jgi:hypothetical protein